MTALESGAKVAIRHNARRQIVNDQADARGGNLLNLGGTMTLSTMTLSTMGFFYPVDKSVVLKYGEATHRPALDDARGRRERRSQCPPAFPSPYAAFVRLCWLDLLYSSRYPTSTTSPVSADSRIAS